MSYLIKNYAKLIKGGSWTIDRVPEALRQQVVAVLENL
mgnify:CR=1 FL=1